MGHRSLGAAVDLLGSELDENRAGVEAVVPALVDILLLYILRTWIDEQTRSSPAAALGLSRGATQLDGEQPPVYTIACDINRITVALQIGYRTTVGLTFTGAGLTDAKKLALLGKAPDLGAA